MNELSLRQRCSLKIKQPREIDPSLTKATEQYKSVKEELEKVLRKMFTESLILAQDKRWRHA